MVPMIRLGRFQMSIEGLLALGLLVALTLGGVRCAAYRQGGDDARLEQDYVNAHKASLAGRKARVAGDSARLALKVGTQRVMRRSTRLTAQGDSLRATLDRADSLAMVSDSVPVLRDLVLASNAEARRFIDSTTVLQAAIDTLTVTQARALVAWDVERERNANASQAKDAVIRALERRECRVLGLRCPSRRTAFVGGAVATLLLVSVAR